MAELVIDLSEVDKGMIGDLVAVRKGLQDVFKATPTLEDVSVSGIRMWAQGVLKFFVPSEKESLVRDMANVWVEKLLPRARLQGASWFPVRLDWVPTELIKDPSGQLSSTLAERVGIRNNVQVMHVRAFPRWQRKEHCSIVVKVSTKKEQDKLLDGSEEVVLHGASLVARRYDEARRPLVCYNCHGFGHIAIRCRNPATCRSCASTEHKEDKCEATEYKCANCKGNHKVTDPKCQAYIKEKTKYKNLSNHV